MNYRAARLSKRQRAMLDFAVKLTAAALERGGSRPRAAAARRILRARHLGHCGGRRLLQHVEPRGFGDRHAAEHGLSRPGAVEPRDHATPHRARDMRDLRTCWMLAGVCCSCAVIRACFAVAPHAPRRAWRRSPAHRRHPAGAGGHRAQRHGGGAGDAAPPASASTSSTAAATRSMPRSRSASRSPSPIRAPAISAAAASW